MHNSEQKVLIVAKCIVNPALSMRAWIPLSVLIVAKCIVNSQIYNIYICTATY